MKNLLLLFILFFATEAISVAPYGVKGQNQTTIYPNVNQVPNNQVTNLGGINALFETGNTNILANPSFEHSTYSTSWSLTGTGTFSTETTKVISGKKSLKIVLSSSTPSVVQSSTLYAAQYADGVQGLAMARIWSDIPMVMCSVQAGTVSTTNCITTAGNSLWGLYKIPFILGATSNGISIASTSSQTGTVYIDDAFLGAVDLKQDIDQSRIAGASYFAGTASCSWTRTSATVGAFATVAACPGPTIEVSNMGTWATTDSDLPRQTVTNLSAGTYKAKFIGIVNNSTPTVAMFSINDGTTTCSPMVSGGNSTTNSTFIVECVFVYTSAGTRTFELYTGSATGVNQVTNSVTSPPSNTKFILEYFGSGQIYSASCGANCVTDFVANTDSAYAVSGENVDWLNGNCVLTANQIVCTPVTGTFTVKPSCQASADQGAASQTVAKYDYTNSTTSSLKFTIFLSTTGGNTSAVGLSIACNKTGADFTATRTIVGSFNEVMTTPNVSKPKTCYASYGGAAATLASPVVISTGTAVEMYDSCNAVSAPTFSATGTYLNTTFANGTFANSSAINCRCEAFDAATGNPKDCMLYWETGDQTVSTTSNGGFVTNTFSTNAAGTAVNSWFNITCEGSAP